MYKNILTLTLPEEAAEVTTAWLVETGALEGAAEVVVALAEVTTALEVAGELEPAPGTHWEYQSF